MHDIHHATEILLQTARDYSNRNAIPGDLVAAAYRLAATKLREHGCDDSAKDLERAAERAEACADCERIAEADGDILPPACPIHQRTNLVVDSTQSPPPRTPL